MRIALVFILAACGAPAVSSEPPRESPSDTASASSFVCMPLVSGCNCAYDCARGLVETSEQRWRVRAASGQELDAVQQTWCFDDEGHGFSAHTINAPPPTDRRCIETFYDLGSCGGECIPSTVYLDCRPRGEECVPASQTAEPPHASGFTWLMLHDIQGMEGGRAIYVRPDRSVVVEVVGPREPEGLDDARYESVLSGDTAARLAALLTEVDFRSMNVPERLGVPDEGRAVLAVRFDDGVMHRTAKWQNDVHPRFTRLYDALMQIADTIAATTEAHHFDYDWEWRPSGVDWPPLR